MSWSISHLSLKSLSGQTFSRAESSTQWDSVEVCWGEKCGKGMQEVCVCVCEEVCVCVEVCVESVCGVCVWSVCVECVCGKCMCGKCVWKVCVWKYVWKCVESVCGKCVCGKCVWKCVWKVFVCGSELEECVWNIWGMYVVDLYVREGMQS